MVVERAVSTVGSPRKFVWGAALEDNMASFWVRQGDTGRPLAVLLKNLDGSDASVPAGTTCAFSMTQRQTGHVVQAVAALADGPAPGSNNQATVNFDTTRPGLYDAVWVVTYPGGGVETFPTSSRGVDGYVVEVVSAL